MQIKRVLTTAAITGISFLTLAFSAGATTISYTTNSPVTGFGTSNVSNSNSLSSSSGAAATINFVDLGSASVSTPTNVAYGNFTVTCAACSTGPFGTSATFNAFTFKLFITDSTDGATGVFVGTSSGGTIFSNSSNVNINWSPLQLGPNASNANSGSFGSTFFQIESFTNIVAPNTGSPAGQTSVQGRVDSVSSTPEPATFGLIGSALLGLGFVRRRRSAR